jgi:hypothetical protein
VAGTEPWALVSSREAGGQKHPAARVRARPEECLRPTKVKRQAIFALDQALATKVQKGSGKGWHQELWLLD